MHLDQVQGTFLSLWSLLITEGPNHFFPQQIDQSNQFFLYKDSKYQVESL